MWREKLQVKRFGRYVPIIGWARAYQRAWLRDDLVSGVVVGAIMMPVAMAYAQMAGVPVQAGLYSAIVGMTAYAIFATSRHLKITTSSTMSIMSIAVVAPLAASDPAAFMALSSALALTVGIIMLILGIAKLGFISDFLAKSVMTGYIFGVACLIAISQLPKVFGVSGGSGTFFEQLQQFISKLPETNVYALALGIGTIAIVLFFKRFKPLIPGALVALVLGTALSSLLQLNALYGVSVVGVIPTGMSSFAIPSISLSAIPTLVVGAAGIVFLAVGETLGTGRPTRRDITTRWMRVRSCWRWVRRTWSWACFRASRWTCACPARRAVRRRVSARNFRPWSARGSSSPSSFSRVALRDRPSAVLGAVVLGSILGLFNFAEFRRYSARRKSDFVLAVTALVGVLSTSVGRPGRLRSCCRGGAVVSRQPALPRDPGRTAAVIRRHDPHADSHPFPTWWSCRLDAAVVLLRRRVGARRSWRDGRTPPPLAVRWIWGRAPDRRIGTSDMLRDLTSDLRRSDIDLLLPRSRLGAAADAQRSARSCR